MLTTAFPVNGTDVNRRASGMFVIMPPAVAKPVRAFVSACQNGDAETIDRLIAEGLSPDTTD